MIHKHKNPSVWIPGHERKSPLVFMDIFIKLRSYYSPIICKNVNGAFVDDIDWLYYFCLPRVLDLLHIYIHMAGDKMTRQSHKVLDFVVPCIQRQVIGCNCACK